MTGGSILSLVVSFLAFQIGLHSRQPVRENGQRSLPLTSTVHFSILHIFPVKEILSDYYTSSESLFSYPL